MTNDSLPRWDLTPIFPSLDSPDLAEALQEILRRIDDLTILFDRLGVRRRSDSSVDDDFAARYEEATNRINELLERVRVVGGYLTCFVTTDASDETAQARQALLETHRARLEPLRSRYVAWMGTSDIETLMARSDLARAHAFPLRKARLQAAHQMSEPEEELAAELHPSGLTGWARLHGRLTANLIVPMVLDGDTRRLPMSEVRSLANDPRREVRRDAYVAEMEAWKSVDPALTAAMNGIKGFQRVVRRKRGYENDIEPSLLANNIDQATLDAMHEACREAFPVFHRYLALKAKALHLEDLAWYDINAPIGSATRVWTWDEAMTFIVEQFGSYSSRLARFASRAFQERWIDAEPRFGKEGGAYCAGILPNASRVMMNFDGSFSSVSTLAHELGHAYHNDNLVECTPLQRMTPSCLAETASIFCETIAGEAALRGADSEERGALLDTTLQRDLLVVIDIHSRFLFEKTVFERRAERDLTTAELRAAMLDSQRLTYGSGVDPLHPYMWAVKGHYYGPTFYNYPYTFGLLFGLGLYARYRAEPLSFQDSYDHLLASTGLDDARSLADRFGIDITGIDFWRSSFGIIRGHIDELECWINTH